MATRNYVPRTDGEGNIGTLLKRWLKGWFQNLYVSGEISDGNSGVSVTVADLDDAVNDAHTHANKSELDLVSDGDHDIRTDNPHNVTPAQIEAGFNNHYKSLSVYTPIWDISVAPAPAYVMSASTDAPGLLFDSNSTETARISIRLPNDIDLSVNPIFRLGLASFGVQGGGGNQYQVQLTIRAVADGEILTKAIDQTIIETITGVPAESLIKFHHDLVLDKTLLSPDDCIGFAFSRLGADANDTRNGDMVFLGASLIYKKLKFFETI